MLQVKECALPPFFYGCFTLGPKVGSLKEFGGVSHGIKALVEFDPLNVHFDGNQEEL
jgi:hypothetical protein